MCPPEHFAVTYAINPWMEPEKPTDAANAMRQWARLRQAYLDLGHDVRTIEPVAGLPDMVFAANGATVVGGKVLGARFRQGRRVLPQVEAALAASVRGGGLGYSPDGGRSNQPRRAA